MLWLFIWNGLICFKLHVTFSVLIWLILLLHEMIVRFFNEKVLRKLSSIVLECFIYSYSLYAIVCIFQNVLCSGVTVLRIVLFFLFYVAFISCLKLVNNIKLFNNLSSIGAWIQLYYFVFVGLNLLYECECGPYNTISAFKE